MRLLGKCHVGTVERGKEFGLEAGPWGWYVGKGRRGKSSVPYAQGTGAPGTFEAYGVLISFVPGDLSQIRFAIILGTPNSPGMASVLYTSDLSQKALQESLTEAFMSAPVDLGIYEAGVNVAFTDVLRASEMALVSEKLKEMHEGLVKIREEMLSDPGSAQDATHRDSQIESVDVCPQCGSEVRSGSKFCTACGASLR